MSLTATATRRPRGSLSPAVPEGQRNDMGTDTRRDAFNECKG